jgi:hypothetical protein
MLAPIKDPVCLNWSSTNFPKRDELSLRTVRAFPNASRIGFDSRTEGKKK